jgi:hypothetical protein
MKKERYLVFPGHADNKYKYPKELVIADKILGKGQYGVVHFSYNRAN